SVFNEHARHQLPEATGLTLLDQSGKCQATSALAPPVAPDIHGELGNPRVACSRSVRGRRGVGNHLPVVLHDHDGVLAIKPGPHARCCTRFCFKGGYPVFNSLVVNGGDGGVIRGACYSGIHTLVPSPAAFSVSSDNACCRKTSPLRMDAWCSAGI